MTIAQHGVREVAGKAEAGVTNGPLRSLLKALDRVLISKDIQAASLVAIARRAGRPEIGAAFLALSPGIARRAQAAIDEARRLAGQFYNQLSAEIDAARGAAQETRTESRPGDRAPVSSEILRSKPARALEGLRVRVKLVWAPTLDEEASYSTGVLRKLGELRSKLSDEVDELALDDPDADIVEELRTGGPPEQGPAIDLSEPARGVTAPRRRTLLRLSPPAAEYRIDQIQSLEEWVDDAARMVHQARRAGREVTVYIQCAVKVRAARARESLPDRAGPPASVIKLASPMPGIRKAPIHGHQTSREAAQASQQPRARALDSSVELGEADIEIVSDPESWVAAGQ